MSAPIAVRWLLTAALAAPATGSPSPWGPRVPVSAASVPLGLTAAQVKRVQALCAAELRAAGWLRAEGVRRCELDVEAERSDVRAAVPAFIADRYEVTGRALQACVAARACQAPPRWLAERMKRWPDRPAEFVTFFEAAAFCTWQGGHLPSDAQWTRLARRADGSGIFPWGDDWPTDSQVNVGRLADNQIDPPLVAGLPDDADGFVEAAAATDGASNDLAHVAGNVWEWTRDVALGAAPAPSEGVLRGGSYLTPPSMVRTTVRVAVPATARMRGVGFRCVY